MSNVIDWLNATAEFMVKDRPDAYKTHSEAVEELSSMMDSMREYNNMTGLFSSYALIWIPDDDGEEWLLTRKLATVLLDFTGEDAVAYAYTKDSGVLKHGIESLPDILDEGLDF